LFVTVTVFDALVPVCTSPKASVPGEIVTGAIAVLDSDAVFGVFEASVLIVSVPGGRAPTEVEGGVRVTEIVQLERAASGTVLEHVPRLQHS
jgi:hypothetical protein